MKIVLTGGGTGGHFYPLIAVAQAINKLVEEQKLVEAKLYYFAPTPLNAQLLFENRVEFHQITAGKWRRYFSLRNFFDGFKTLAGILRALWQLYVIYPDVVFSKGGYASFPTLMACKILKLPVIIHESDSHPGRVSLWSAKFAVRVAVSYPEAAQYFPSDKTAITGNPIREELLHPIANGAHEFLKLDPQFPIIYVTGGSQGASILNETLLDILPQLLTKYQVIHQTGEGNHAEIEQRLQTVLANSELKQRYHLFANLDSSAQRMMAGVTSLVVSRAGSAIFEFANWGIPAIIIPIPESISHDQRSNAFTYARSGGAVVIEQINLTPSVLLSEINRLLGNPELLAKMKAGAKSFARPEAARNIAEEIVTLALAHEV
jgi:UDP-N-acetylglucosamine--N-acetylmuramyl-(pentapeptide) pyrophosphoryl-undecaprenol N-acetylglucosamine transferase